MDSVDLLILIALLCFSTGDTQKSSVCKDNKFRNLVGECNNLAHPLRGSANQALVRLVRSDYEDNRSTPRGGYLGTRLPSPRVVSTTIHGEVDSRTYSVTNMFVMFGQFMMQDVVSTTTPSNYKKNVEGCCKSPGRYADPVCFSIDVPEKDWFHKGIQTCLTFGRSEIVDYPASGNRKQGIRQQKNRQTSFIDASHLYSQVQGIHNVIMSHPPYYQTDRAGSKDGNLPTFESFTSSQQTQLKGLGFGPGGFVAGDPRVNNNPQLISIYNIFIREHNRIASQMANLVEPSVGAREARRILVAEMQHIVYNEYLPALLGELGMEEYKLWTGQPRDDYDEKAYIGVSSEFATAAFRFGHSMITGLVSSRYKDTGKLHYQYNLSDTIGNPSIMQRSGKLSRVAYNEVLQALVTENAQDVDVYFTSEMTNKFLKRPFRGTTEILGQDIVSINIQRGRDRGLAGYTTYRVYCGMSRVTNWSDVPPEIPVDLWLKLSEVYKEPGDIDLYTGGLSEDHVPDSIVGPTFHCIIGEQFANLKVGDRFFYSHTNGAGYRSAEEFKEISRRTFGDIICQNSDLISTPSNVFLPVSDSNPEIACSDPRRRMDITKLTFQRRPAPKPSPQPAARPEYMSRPLTRPGPWFSSGWIR